MLMDSTAPRPLRVARKASRIFALRARNRVSRASVTGDAPVTVSLTSFGSRINVVGHTIESIAAGTVRPQRLTLWVDDPEKVLAEQPMLRRLRHRGLEILATQDWKPHKKYWSLLEREGICRTPIVTADDDVMYPDNWLEGLLDAHLKYPDHFLGYRAHWVEMDDTGILPYSEWTPSPISYASPRVFITGVGGTVYPRSLQSALLAHGTVFTELAPRADDVWVNAVAVAAGVPKMAIPATHLKTPYTYPRTQAGGLHETNVTGGGNDPQIQATLSYLGLDRDSFLS